MPPFPIISSRMRYLTHLVLRSPQRQQQDSFGIGSVLRVLRRVRIAQADQVANRSPACFCSLLRHPTSGCSLAHRTQTSSEWQVSEDIALVHLPIQLNSTARESVCEVLSLRCQTKSLPIHLPQRPPKAHYRTHNPRNPTPLRTVVTIPPNSPHKQKILHPSTRPPTATSTLKSTKTQPTQAPAM